MHETLCFSIQSPSPNLDDLPLRCDGCETVSCVVGSVSDHGRIMLGSVPHCKWGFKCFSCMCGSLTVNGIARGVASFGGSLARCVFERCRCTKPYVFPYKVRPRTSMIYLCGATVARRSRVWSDRSRIMVGSCSDRFRIVNGVSSVFRACAVDRIPL